MKDIKVEASVKTRKRHYTTKEKIVRWLKSHAQRDKKGTKK